MQYLRHIGRWLWRAWPVILLLPVIALHLVILNQFSTPADKVFVNKLTGTLLQICGGMIILYSLDGNLGLFKKKGLFAVFVLWLKEFPRRNSRAINFAAEVGVHFGGTATITVGKKPPTTLEERIERIEQRIEEEAQKLNELRGSLNDRIGTLKAELEQSILKVDSGLRDLAYKVESSAIGGLKQQLFGVLLALYGAVVSVFA